MTHIFHAGAAVTTQAAKDWHTAYEVNVAATGRLMSYTACEVVGGNAYVADTEELTALAWVTHAEIPLYVPYGLFGPVQEHLDTALNR